MRARLAASLSEALLWCADRWHAGDERLRRWSTQVVAWGERR